MTYEKLYKSPILYVIIICLGISLRLFNINDGLWLDEIWSMSISRIEHSSFEIIEACKNDTHPPFFDLLLHYFLVLFGSNEINGRILSLIIGGIGIFSTLYYTKKITDNNISTLIATALISFSFFHIYYSSEGRFYTFLYLLSLSVICELYLFLKTKRILHIIVFVAVSTVLAYTHYYGAILLFGLALIVFFLWIIKEIDLKTFLYFVGAGILILVLYSPWLPYMLVRKSDSSWMNPPKIWAFFEYLYRYTGKNPVEFVFILFALFLSIKHFKENKMFS